MGQDTGNDNIFCSTRLHRLKIFLHVQNCPHHHGHLMLPFYAILVDNRILVTNGIRSWFVSFQTLSV